jgi:uncharacterized repeat protein (TIGR03803 family)
MINRSAWGRVCIVILSCAATVAVSPAQTFTTLLSFDGTNGARPVSMALVQGIDGNYYGTASAGGINTYGTVFKVTPAGILTTLHNFHGPDGNGPNAGLVLATDGNFYGTTELGGVHNNGTVFRITPEGELTTLHSFDALDGANPMTALAQGSGGNLYGTTSRDGASGYGTVFTITPLGALITLHNFVASDGGYPGALVPLYNGNLVGTAVGRGYGTIFTITPQGTFTSVHRFQGSDGAYPDSGLTVANDGNLYGTTSSGGANREGTIFKITAQGTLTTIYNFQAREGGGTSALIQATDGNFYGAAFSGGAGNGTLFRFTPTGTFTTLASFGTQSAPGEYPDGGVFQGTDGNLYGTTDEGATFGNGTLFRLTLPIGPFVESLPTSGKVGADIQILGTDLTGATSVTFNGIAAAFTIVSPTLITATVPSGAASGPVQVTTPGGELLSNVAFRVEP